MPPDYRDWCARVSPDLAGGGLWLRGGELNTLPPSEYEARPFRVLFVRLSTYQDVAESFTHGLLYQVAAGTPGVFPDLAYLPPRSDAAAFDRDGVPWMLGTQTKRGPADFDLVGLSASLVQEIPNIPTLLRRSGIPVVKSERLARADIPLVLLGGASAPYTSAVWGQDPLVDGVFVGEGAAAVRRLLEVCRDLKAQTAAKANVLERLAHDVPGFFEPDRPSATVRKARVAAVDDEEAPWAAPTPYVLDRLGVASLPISEGCPCFCAFCAEGWDRKPYRERSPLAVAADARRLKARQGLDSVELYSFNFNMHSGIYHILEDATALFRSVGLKSQRLDFLAHDPRMIETLRAVGKTTLTCGIEGISPRLRRRLHKGLPEEDLWTGLAAILRGRPRQVKVFLLATGHEETEDYAEFERFLARLGKLVGPRPEAVRVIFSMTPLVRFPWTPLEFEDAPAAERCAEVMAQAGRLAATAGHEFRQAAGPDEYWVCQVLARAPDGRVGRAMLRAVEQTGFIYYRDVPRRFRLAFEAALRGEGLDPTALLAGFSLEESRAKPWARIETGVNRDFLWRAHQAALGGEELDYCLGRGWRAGWCALCGACSTPDETRRIVSAAQEAGPPPEVLEQKRRALRAAEGPVNLLVEVGCAAAGLPRRFAGVALARALMLADEHLVPLYRGYADAFWATGDGPVHVTGADAISLLWLPTAREALSALAAEAAGRERVNVALGAWGRWIGLTPHGWRPAGLVIESPFPFDFGPYATRRGLKHRVLRVGDDAWRCEFAPAALRKRVVSGIAWSRSLDGGYRVEVALGEKFSALEFLEEAFRLPDRRHAARLRARSVGPAAGA